MCYETDALPPDHGRDGAAGTDRDLVLAAADGTEFDARLVRAGSPTGMGIVILPDVRGLHPFYRALACRFSELGFDSLAIDYFGRTAGRGERGEDFDFMSHVQQTRPENIAMDVAAAIDYLRSPDGGAARRIFTVGFCFGGAQSWRQAAVQPGLGGAIGFYGRPERVVDVIPAMEVPLLMLMAGDDQSIPADAVEDLDRRMHEQRVPHSLHVYEGAPHSFFDRSYDRWADACLDAWDRIIAFTQEPPAAAHR
ncbi:MAG: carboxymethylenebutenolidase [Chloroflexota bacterium]|jgi:carboxymethylenebutenolidase|nr:carboxymethylenebutenolidase [Chloroflexota bacterium]